MPPSYTIQWEGGIPFANRYFKDRSFEFLNIQHSFSKEIDWNYADYGKLWTYNLNYFDFLNQSKITKQEGLNLIQDYIQKDSTLKDGKEPYPISLRVINWVKFLSQNQHKDSKIDAILFHHCQILLHNLEYHLLANHLLENAFSILFGAYYFQDDRIYVKAKKLLIKQLNEQVLKDGAHYELSAMYHQILFHRLLDCIQFIRLNPSWKHDELLSFLENKASMMRSWLEQVTYQNGDIPMVSDAAFGIAPTSAELLSFANYLNIMSSELPLSDSGYRKIIKDDFELFLDVGNIQPSYQPGHTHSDTFHFELHKNQAPVFVDTGISTYEKNQQRQYERSTSSHNTVVIDGKNQTEVWGGFRVARRAKVIHLAEDENSVTAVHDGYKRHGFLHKRTFDWSKKNTLIIEDDTGKSTGYNAVASFHLHSSIDQPVLEHNRLSLPEQNIIIRFQAASAIEIQKYKLPKGYNKFESAYKIIVNFDRNLVTQISL